MGLFFKVVVVMVVIVVRCDEVKLLWICWCILNIFDDILGGMMKMVMIFFYIFKDIMMKRLKVVMMFHIFKDMMMMKGLKMMCLLYDSGDKRFIIYIPNTICEYLIVTIIFFNLEHFYLFTILYTFCKIDVVIFIIMWFKYF